MTLPPNFLHMIRDDFVALLNHPLRAQAIHAADQRLARDLHDLGGMAAVW